MSLNEPNESTKSTLDKLKAKRQTELNALLENFPAVRESAEDRRLLRIQHAEEEKKRRQNEWEERKKKLKGIEKLPINIVGDIALGKYALELMIKERDSRFEKERKRRDKIAGDKWWRGWHQFDEVRSWNPHRRRGTRERQLAKFGKWGPGTEGPYVVTNNLHGGRALLLTEAEAKEYFQQIRNEDWDKGKELAVTYASGQGNPFGSFRSSWKLAYENEEDWNIMASFLAATKKIHKCPTQATFPSKKGIASMFSTKELGRFGTTSKSMKEITQKRINSLKSWKADGGRRGSRKRKCKRKRKTKRHKKKRKNKRKKTRKKR